MKSEHRHELAENDLEVFINKLRARFAELMELHGNRILLWASAVLLLIAAFVFYKNNSSAEAEGWAALYGSRNAEDLAGVADSYRGTPVGQWAKLRMGEQYMQSGLTLMFTDREAGKADLEEARNAFNELLNDSKTSDEIRERALYGLATVLESLSGSDLKPAIETYQKLLSSFPNTPYQAVVKERIEELENRSTQEFYAWFAEQKPEPKDLELPKDLQGQSPGLNLPPGFSDSQTGNQPSGQEMPAKEAEGKTTPKDGAKPGPKLSVPSAPAFPPTDKDKNGKAEGKKTGDSKAESGEKPKAGNTKTGKAAATKQPEPSPSKQESKPAPVKKEQEKPAAPKTETPKEKAEKPNPESK